jgi:hypothetical protein
MPVNKRIYSLVKKKSFQEEFCQHSAPGAVPLGPCRGLFVAHRLHLSHTALLMLESLGTQKCWTKVAMGSFMELLDKDGSH